MRLFGPNAAPSSSGETQQAMDNIDAAISETGREPLTKDEQIVETSGNINRDRAVTLTYAFLEDETGGRWPVMTKTEETTDSRHEATYQLTPNGARMVSQWVGSKAKPVVRTGTESEKALLNEMREMEAAIRDVQGVDEGRHTVMYVPFAPSPEQYFQV